MILYLRLRNLRRLREIAAVLVNYGFGLAVMQLGLRRLVPVSRWRWRWLRREPEISPAERLRMALGELGPTFIKLGQVLSSRYDLLPPAYLHELRRLQDEAPPVAYRQVAAALTRELGATPEQLFARFDPTPLSSASIGQVHAAATKEGREVTVKVQRPGVGGLIETDLAIMADAAHFVHVRFEALRRYDLPGLVREFASIMRDELRYRIEAHNAHTLREHMGEFPWVQVPEVVWELTTQRVLTTERLYGVRIDHVEDIRGQGFDPGLLATRFAQCMLTQIFIVGFFHGDPHQGNVWVAADGRLAFLDFGIVGRLDRAFRRALIDLVLALRRQDSEAALDDIADMGMMGERQDVAILRHDLRRLFTRYYFLPRRDFPLGELFVRVVQLMSQHRVPVSWEFSLLGKALVLTEGICHELDPHFDFDRAAQPVVERLKRERLSPRYLGEEVGDFARELGRNLGTLPTRLNQVLSELRRGTLRVRTASDDLDPMLAQRAMGHNRVAVAVILAGLEVAAALFLLCPGVSWAVKLWVSIPVFAVGALALAALLGGAIRPRL